MDDPGIASKRSTFRQGDGSTGLPFFLPQISLSSARFGQDCSLIVTLLRQWAVATQGEYDVCTDRKTVVEAKLARRW